MKPIRNNNLFGMAGIGLFGLPEKTNSRKNLTYAQAKKKYPKMNPYGDADRDGVSNWLDCRPFDRKRQDVPLGSFAASPAVTKIPISIEKPIPGGGYGNVTNADGSVTLGWNVNVKDNQGNRMYPVPEGVTITNPKILMDRTAPPHKQPLQNPGQQITGTFISPAFKVQPLQNPGQQITGNFVPSKSQFYQSPSSPSKLKTKMQRYR
jgi:hypothetical protein